MIGKLLIANIETHLRFCKLQGLSRDEALSAILRVEARAKREMAAGNKAITKEDTKRWVKSAVAIAHKVWAERDN